MLRAVVNVLGLNAVFGEFRFYDGNDFFEMAFALGRAFPDLGGNLLIFAGPEVLESKVLYLLRDSEYLAKMSQAASELAVRDSTERLANLVRELVVR